MNAAWDSGAPISNSPIGRPPEFEPAFEAKPESKFALDEDEDEPEHPPPLAAAAAALVSAAGGSIENGGTSIFREAETGLGGTVGDVAEGSSLAALEAAATNLLAAARRSAELTAIFGAEAAFLASGAAFWLPFSLHFSRSSKSSRAL